MPEVDPLTIEERFTRDLGRRQTIIATQYGGDADAYLEHFLAELNAEYSSPAEVSERPKFPRFALTDRQARRAARKARRYADPLAFPSFKKEPSAWKVRKADRVIHHQTAVSTGHSCACGAKATRFIAGKFDSKLWMCAGCFAARESRSENSRKTTFFAGSVRRLLSATQLAHVQLTGFVGTVRCPHRAQRYQVFGAPCPIITLKLPPSMQ